MSMFDNRRYVRHLCECGLCDGWAKSGDRFVYNHHRRGKHVSEKTLERMRKAHKGKPNGREGTHHSKATKEKMSKAQMGKVLSEETIERIIKARESQVPPMLGKHHSKEVKRKMSKSRLRNWQNPEYREKQLKAIFDASNIKLNKVERKLRNLLNKLFPREYKYVGDGSLLIGYKNPDFININGQKKIIEMFGDYWHGEKRTKRTKYHEEQRRIRHFAKYGFKTLIIWEHELADIVKLKEKIFEYVGEI